MVRDEQLRQLQQVDSWDFIVIGGGATGLGIALEATTRGYKTILIEQSDFAKSTSGKSTKLVHGGVRYLAQGRIKLVHEASIERARLWKNAPHLVRNQTFIIPVYSRWESIKYTLGLKLYDWMAGHLSLGSSHFISRKETLNRIPGINPEKLVGGVHYHDGQFDDARLALNLAQTIIQNGGCAINYFEATGLLKDENNCIKGLNTLDIETGLRYELNGKVVINATGVFVDDILRLDNPSAQKIISVSQGVHLVLDRKFFPSDDALMIPKTSDGRVLFLIPWRNKLLIGTTDTPVQNASLEPVPLDEEIRFILNTVSEYLLKKPTREDVLSVFAGLRPLAVQKNENQKTKEISRSHKIVVSQSGLFTMLGGKWTTYRRMGQDMVDIVEKHFNWNRTKSLTSKLPVYNDRINEKESSVDDGSNVLISQSLDIYKSQVILAVKHEMARTIEDVLSRRTRALLLDASESLRIAPQIANIMAETLGKDASWVEEQLINYSSLCKNYILRSI